MEVAAKLQLKPGKSVAVIGDPRGAALELGTDHPAADAPGAADAVIAFAANARELDGCASPSWPVRQVALDEVWSALRFRPA